MRAVGAQRSWPLDKHLICSAPSVPPTRQWKGPAWAWPYLLLLEAGSFGPADQTGTPSNSFRPKRTPLPATDAGICHGRRSRPAELAQRFLDPSRIQGGPARICHKRRSRRRIESNQGGRLKEVRVGLQVKAVKSIRCC